MNPIGPLGHGNTTSLSSPHMVKSLEKDHSETERITCGRFFNLALNKKGDVYHWGNGEYGAFGDGHNKNYSTPMVNEYFQYLKVEELLKIKKLKSCESFSVALMNNDRLYGWGSNESGQMGIKA